METEARLGNPITSPAAKIPGTLVRNSASTAIPAAVIGFQAGRAQVRSFHIALPSNGIEQGIAHDAFVAL